MTKARKFYFNTTLTSFMKCNPRKFRQTINPTASCPLSFVINEVSCSDFSTISEAFNGYFESVFGDDSGTTPDIDDNPKIFPIPGLEISYTGIYNLLLSIATTESGGPDGIPNVFLKR